MSLSSSASRMRFIIDLVPGRWPAASPSPTLVRDV
jgi:hypothetical protein